MRKRRIAVCLAFFSLVTLGPVFAGSAGARGSAVPGAALGDLEVFVFLLKGGKLESGGAREPGRVESQDGKIFCRPNCSAHFDDPRVVLTATASPGYVFDHWELACTGTAPTCSLTLNAPSTNVYAVFREAKKCECEKVSIQLGGLGVARNPAFRKRGELPWTLQFTVNWRMTCGKGEYAACTGQVNVTPPATKAVRMTAPSGVIRCEGESCDTSTTGSYVVRADLSISPWWKKVQFRITPSCIPTVTSAPTYLVTFAFKENLQLDRKKSGVAIITP